VPADPDANRQLHCAACGQPLAPGRPPRRSPAPADPFRGRTIAGARLRKLLATFPDHLEYLGTHAGLHADVRVEIFPAEVEGRGAVRLEALFRRVARARQVHSPAVLPVLDLGRTKDCWYILAEMPPDSLRTLLDRKGRLPLQQTLALAEDVLTGLTALEQAGLSHGDVRPETIAMDYDGTARLDRPGAPFAPSELGRLTVTQGGAVRGPAHYMAPERWVDERRADMPSDLYSLGVTLYEALAGRPPFDGQSAQDVMRAHLEAALPDLQQAAPGLPESVCAFVERLLKRDPAERPACAAGALEDLRRVMLDLARQGVIESPAVQPPLARRILREVRKAGLWTILALALVALAAVPPILWYARRGRQGADQAAELQRAPLKVLLMVEDAADADPHEATAVRALLALALECVPALSPADPFLAAQLLRDGMDVERVRNLAAFPCVLTASSRPGLRRRHWTLTLSGSQPAPWTVRSEASVDENGRGDMRPLEAAARELMELAAARLESTAALQALPHADAGTWSEVAEALRAEADGRWCEATRRARAAAAHAPDARAFAFLASFYGTVCQLTRPDSTEPMPPVPDPEGLPAEMAGLSRVLRALREADAPLVKERLADFLVEFPHSARGYTLLGLWRLHTLRRPEEALAALRHAVEIDPGYLPAAYACVEALVKHQPDGVEPFLRDYRGRIAHRELAERVEARVREAGWNGGPISKR